VLTLDCRTVAVLIHSSYRRPDLALPSMSSSSVANVNFTLRDLRLAVLVDSLFERHYHSEERERIGVSPMIQYGSIESLNEGMKKYGRPSGFIARAWTEAKYKKPKVVEGVPAGSPD